jgi:hypothetical protein
MMQVAVHQIIYVVAMRDGLVAASGAVGVCGLVRVALVLGRAVCRVLGVHRQFVVVDVAIVRMM